MTIELPLRVKVKLVDTGCGFPTKGDLVADKNGDGYNGFEVVATESAIHTGQPGYGNWVYAIAELVYLDETDETFPCGVSFEVRSA